MFRSQLALGAAGLLAAGATVLLAASSVHRSPTGAHHVVVAGQQFTYPALNVAAAVLLFLACLGGIVLVRTLTGVFRQLRASRDFMRALPVLGPLPEHPAVSVIDDPTPQAFCAGYLRPRVYISRGALDLLSKEELAAVLSHEERHRSTRDPLRFACGRLLSQALFFLPALRPLGHRYEELAEHTADQAAIRDAGGEPAPLAAALLAFEEASPPATAGISNERVDSLLGQTPRWRPPSPLIAVSLIALAGLIILVWRASAVASAHATFNLPVLSSQPCMLVLALLPIAALSVAAACRPRSAWPASP